MESDPRWDVPRRTGLSVNALNVCTGMGPAKETILRLERKFSRGIKKKLKMYRGTFL